MVLVATLFFIFSAHGVGEANSFPFRAVKVGSQLPPVVVKDLGTQQEVDLARFAGKPLLLVFFGADLPAKKERAVLALKAVRDLASFTAARGVVTVVVNGQGDSAEVIAEVAAAAGLSGPVYADVDRKVYGDLGVFVMPAVLLVAADGKVAAGLGFSRDLAKNLQGELEIMLGEKSREQVEAALHPEMVERSSTEKGASRHFKMGLVMIERGQPEAARREFAKALSFAPDLGEAHVYLGCLQLDDGRIDEAQASLAKGLELEPDLVAGRICQARIRAEREDPAGAIEDLTRLLPQNPGDDRLHYALGNLLALRADPAGAMAEYRQAYELLRKKSRPR
jgi:thioredoxin-like negative regulator of GroEL